MTRELRQALSKLQGEFDVLKNKEDVTADELRAKADELKEMRAKLDAVLEAEAITLPEVEETRAVEKVETEEVDEKRYTEAFLKDLRRRKLTEDEGLALRAKNAPSVQHLKSGVDADGGYIVPKDVDTAINHYKRQFVSLVDLVTVVKTNVLSGSRVFEKLTDYTPLENIDEWDIINDIATPTYEVKNYKISAYAGILPVPRTLLQDTDVNLMNELAMYIARKDIVTRNTKILAILTATYTQKTAVTKADDFKTILNTKLDPSFALGATIITNQDGFNWLDTLKDNDGRYLLQPDVTDTTVKRFLGHVVKVVPNSLLKTNTKKVPFYIGNMKEAVILFDRGVYEVKTTDVGGDSFKRNTVDIRVIDRFDVQSWDKDAVVVAELTLA